MMGLLCIRVFNHSFKEEEDRMKKFLALLLVCLLMASVTACGSKDDSYNSTYTPSGDSDSGNSGSGSSGGDEDGYTEGGDWGYIGDVMHTYWFDFTVDDAYTCSDYEGYTAPEGKQLVVVTVSVKNTFLESLPMNQYDFQIQWGGEGDDDFEWPISAMTDDQFPDEYTLGINESRTGVLVYEVPADTQDYSVSFGEYFEDESEGDVYFIYFTATSDGASV